MWQDVVATIIRKTDGRPSGVCQISVRSSAIGRDHVIRVSREEYAHLHPGMLVTVFMLGWGPLSTWRLRREDLEGPAHRHRQDTGRALSERHQPDT
jgi:hypothetical protein